jgi:hypothetical protein
LVGRCDLAWRADDREVLELDDGTRAYEGSRALELVRGHEDEIDIRIVAKERALRRRMKRRQYDRARPTRDDAKERRREVRAGRREDPNPTPAAIPNASRNTRSTLTKLVVSVLPVSVDHRGATRPRESIEKPAHVDGLASPRKFAAKTPRRQKIRGGQRLLLPGVLASWRLSLFNLVEVADEEGVG